MKQYLISFRAEYYCQGYEWSNFMRLVSADSFEEACERLKNEKTYDWVHKTPTNFENLTLE